MSGFKQISRAQARGVIARDERIDEMSTAIIECTSRGDFASEIGRLWRTAQDSFLAIGRYLVSAAAKLEHGQWAEMVETDLPFGRQTAYKLRMVAEAVDGGRLPEASLPNDYNTAYEIATLTTDALCIAGEQHLIRPDVKRHEIVAFKRSIAPPVTQTTIKPRRLATLRRKRQALLNEVARIDAEIAAAEGRGEGTE